VALSRTTLLGAISGASGSFGTGNYTPSAFTPPSSSLLVVAVVFIENASVTTDPRSAMTISGGGWTYTGRIDAVASPTDTPTATKIWTAPVGTGASMSLTVGSGGRSAGLYAVSAVAYTGYDVATPVGATASGSATSGFTSPPTAASITLNGAPAAASETFAVVGIDKSAAGATPGTNGTWTELHDVTNTDWGGLESEARTGSTSTTVDWADLRSGGGALFNWAAAALEIRQASAAVASLPPRLSSRRMVPLLVR
jgi:hypothetical protein